MLRTNNKKVNEKIKNFILESVDFEGYDDFKNIVVSIENFKEVCRAIFEIADSEKFYTYYQNKYTMLYDWFNGLPSVLDTACYLYNGSAVEMMGDWLEQTESERSKYTELEAERKVNYLLAKMILNNCR